MGSITSFTVISSPELGSFGSFVGAVERGWGDNTEAALGEIQTALSVRGLTTEAELQRSRWPPRFRRATPIATPNRGGVFPLTVQKNPPFQVPTIRPIGHLTRKPEALDETSPINNFNGPYSYGNSGP